jgi:hypothetical protein
MNEIYKTLTMLEALQSKPPVPSFLKDRYFPVGPKSVFATQEVLVDIKEGTAKMAPVVLSHKGGVTVGRDSFKSDSILPAFVAPQRPLTLDELAKRQFGEALYSGLTPEQRAAAILADDLDELDRMITRREEYMAARCLVDNGYDMIQYADEYGVRGEDYTLHFYDGGANPATYVVSNAWDTPSGDPAGDIDAIVGLLSSKGLEATDIIGSRDAIGALLGNEKVKQLLDIKNWNAGLVEGSTPEPGVSRFGYLNIGGKTLEVFSYDAQYVDDTDGQTKAMFPSGSVVVTAKAAGKTLYGAITQIEADDEFHTVAGPRVPQAFADQGSNVRTLRLKSRPLLMPNTVNPWISANVL